MKRCNADCSLSPYVFNIFIHDATDYISKGNLHAPVTRKMSISRLFFADDLAIGSFTVNGLQKWIDQAVKYCSDWNLKFNPKNTEILVPKKEGKLMKDERCFMCDQLIVVVN
jgi:hypothetical protein